ncbi:hypothetical protein CIK05_06710 [Bdellovibrio sp. qaytius]|nr:hypothetical protein CIK05_06710 [Bdellovibrio sp. qaytius]
MLGGSAGGSASIQLGWGNETDPTQTARQYGLTLGLGPLGSFAFTANLSSLAIGYSNGPGIQFGLAGIGSTTLRNITSPFEGKKSCPMPSKQ